MTLAAAPVIRRRRNSSTTTALNRRDFPPFPAEVEAATGPGAASRIAKKQTLVWCWRTPIQLKFVTIDDHDQPFGGNLLTGVSDGPGL
jgi:hypothetical protein